ncbi:conserved hypothetical protein [Coccidioides posadasii str. Silveira]|uniref:S-adenosylmethionine-dependent methyltransferase-like protein n=1 Tax=Coccidioides posadasii (strain RMSCC 757 / Silveira) TaxID=443226 RepID=E9DFT2_COCPS|nr:conserved hypothetical protein [Coccidioides posadasii str. Silveira]
MHHFHNNKSQPSLPQIFEAGGEDYSEHQGSNTGLPARYSLVIPGDNDSQQPFYAYSNDQPAYHPPHHHHYYYHHHHHHQQQQQNHDDNYTHPAHSANRIGHELPDSPPPPLSRQQGGRPSLNLVPTSPTFGLSSSSDLSSADPSYTPHSSEASPLVESQPRKLRKSLFGLTSKDKHKDKDPSSRGTKVLGRSISVRRKVPEEDSTEIRMPLHKKSSPQSVSPYPPSINRSSSNVEGQQFDPPRIQRVSTEPLSHEFYPPRQSSAHQYQEGLHLSGSPHPQLQLDQAHLQQPGPSYQLSGPQAFVDQSLQPPAGPNPAQGGMDRQTGLRQPGESMGQNAQPQTAQPPSLSPGPSFKGNLPQPGSGEPDRDTPPPPPSKARDDTSDVDVQALVQKHEELQAKYIKVKRYYFEKEAQVQQLQNTVAHQRMSTSRTVLDDNEYSTRFGRLDGAINNLAFNIRKDWKSIPPWLQGVVNEDAHMVGTKEMTAVGRACLTRWLVDEIFDRYFHPSLEPGLSRQLKIIERNVRRMGKATTEEDKENHLAKLSTWRRTTLDGLGEALQGKLADDHRAQLTVSLVEKLTASLEMNLKDPAPPGLENGVAMIVELAVGIAANIPLESRDVTVEYFLPGSPIIESHMKLETTLRPLANLASESRQSPEPSSASTDRGDQGSLKELTMEGGPSEADTSSSSTTNSGYSSKEGRKKSVFGSLISKKTHSTPNQGQTDSSRPGSVALRDGKERSEGDKDEPMRIRFAAFVAVEVRSKGVGNVIVKAPVYGLV